MKPNCECCNKDLPPNSTQAMICSYECTFCVSCVDHVLLNVCPNCGGGLMPRPIRPQQERRQKISLKLQPASRERVLTTFTREEIVSFARAHCEVPYEDR
ncbi:DUF1272 domain-containing protein [Agaribacter flavus]|uniref:DUF1272 domain-containing protein n=1 Tax=Agaribacter flavus TaxID=1902781 RepID=A0ABV7FP80_9ALTE